MSQAAGRSAGVQDIIYNFFFFHVHSGRLKLDAFFSLLVSNIRFVP